MLKILKNRCWLHFISTCVLQAVWLSISVSHIWTLTSFKEIKVKSLKTVLVFQGSGFFTKLEVLRNFIPRQDISTDITKNPPNHYSEDPPYFSLDSPNELKASSLVIAVSWSSVIIPYLVIKIIKGQ